MLNFKDKKKKLPLSQFLLLFTFYLLHIRKKGVTVLLTAKVRKMHYSTNPNIYLGDNL